MRAIVALYLVIGVVAAGDRLSAAGPVPERNTEVVNNLVFVLTWPVGLYSEVYHGQLSAQEWLQRQACEGGGKLGEEAIPGLIEPESGGAAPQLAVELELLP